MQHGRKACLEYLIDLANLLGDLCNALIALVDECLIVCNLIVHLCKLHLPLLLQAHHCQGGHKSCVWRQCCSSFLLRPSSLAINPCAVFCCNTSSLQMRRHLKACEVV